MLLFIECSFFICIHEYVGPANCVKMCVDFWNNPYPKLSLMWKSTPKKSENWI